MLKGPHHSKFRATTFSFFNATGSNRTEARFKPNVLACNYHTLTLEFVLFVSVAIITTPVFLLQESCCRNIEQVMMATTPNSVLGLDQG